MQSLKISNFGPLRDINLKLNGSKSTAVVIGAQASGKSTLAKTIYFCRRIKNIFIEYLIDADTFQATHINERYLSFLKRVRKAFMGYFGTTKHLNEFSIEFIYDVPNNKKIMRISLDKDRYARISFSPLLKEGIEEIINQMSEVYKNQYESNKSINSLATTLMLKKQTIELIQSQVNEKVMALFNDEYEAIYIPAGRSLLSSLSEQLADIDERKMDMAMQDFISLIRYTRNRFGTKLTEVVENYIKTIKGQIKNADVDSAIVLIKEILKADYISDNDGEKLYYDTMHWVKLMHGSSGQQESLWILLILLTVILDSQKTFIVIEEPEAHLYPIAQKKIVELISLVVNSSASEVFLTTHSPYVLTSYNLLLHSGKIENNPLNKSKESIIPRQYRLDSKKFSSFIIDQTIKENLKSIMDKNAGLIDATEIDKISNIINHETNKLIDLEIEYDM